MKSSIKLSLLSSCLILLGILSGCTPAPNCGVSDYHVTKEADTFDGACTDGDCSLREAVHNANACAGHQTIHLPAGSYHLTRSGPNEDAALTGDLDITDDLTLIGAGAPSIHGDGDRAFQVFSPAVVDMELIALLEGEAILGGGLLNESDLTLSDFTCNYNQVAIPPGGMGDARGGCIFNGGELTIHNAHILENSARQGGGIYNFDSAKLTINGGVLVGNHAEDHGGGIWISPGGSVELNDLEIRLNNAGLNGGGIWNNGSLILSGLLIEENEALSDGGGLYNWDTGEITITDAWFHDNAASRGGGLFNDEGMVHLYQCSLTGNVAAGTYGGGCFNQGTPAGLQIRNTTVSGNTAPAGGSGIFNQDGSLLLEFITVAGNNPEGIHVTGGPELKIRSSIVADNPGGDCGGPALDSLGYNLDTTGGCGFTGMDDLTGVDPRLQPLAMNGGMGPSHQLGPGSPALDTGDRDRCIAHDQRGTARPQNTDCDRGALEMEGGLGSISGWVYIDADRNGVKNPGDGSLTGAMLDLKDGSCPGAGILHTVSTATGGSYEFQNVPPGTYCVHRSMIQQTLFPDYREVTVTDGAQLTDVNFRYLLSPPGDWSIEGTVWHDLCAVPAGPYTTPPPGCVALPGGDLAADGIYDPSEPGIEDVVVVLKGWPCTTATVAGVQTDSDGKYIIPHLTAGTYCLTIDASQPPNDGILIPGEWTYPSRGSQPIEVQVTLDGSSHSTGQNFGWDYQFLPEPPPSPLPSPRGFWSMNGFCREGPGSVYGTVTAFEEGREVEIEGRSELRLPLWWYIRDLKLDLYCWVSDLVLETELDPDKVPTVIAPPTPTPTLTPTPLACSRDLPQDQCEASGGTWFTPTSYQGDPYCVCP